MRHSLARFLLPVFLAPLLLGLLPAGAANAAAYQVVMGISPATVNAGDYVSFYGYIKPIAAGHTVRLQRRTTTGYTTVATTTTRADGKYSFRLRFTTAGRYWYRVLKPAAGGYTQSASATKNVDVYRWRYLEDIEPVEGYASGGAVTVAGLAYTRSVYQEWGWTGDDGYADFNLSKKCRRFEATLGLDDSSFSGSSASFVSSTDGVVRDDRSLAFGQSARVSFETVDYLRLRLYSKRLGTDNSGTAYTAWGNARISCRF